MAKKKDSGRSEDGGRRHLRLVSGGDRNVEQAEVEPWLDPRQCVDLGPEDGNAMGEWFVVIMNETPEKQEWLKRNGFTNLIRKT